MESEGEWREGYLRSGALFGCGLSTSTYIVSRPASVESRTAAATLIAHAYVRAASGELGAIAVIRASTRRGLTATTTPCRRQVQLCGHGGYRKPCRNDLIPTAMPGKNASRPSRCQVAPAATATASRYDFDVRAADHAVDSSAATATRTMVDGLQDCVRRWHADAPATLCISSGCGVVEAPSAADDDAKCLSRNDCESTVNKCTSAASTGLSAPSAPSSVSDYAQLGHAAGNSEVRVAAGVREDSERRLRRTDSARRRGRGRRGRRLRATAGRSSRRRLRYSGRTARRRSRCTTRCGRSGSA